MCATGKKRVPWIDFAKELGIYLVVLGHCYPAESPAPLPRNFIYLFHMPLFFFLAGCVFKTEDNLYAMLRKIIIGLLVPTFAWSIIFSVWNGIVFGDGDVFQRSTATLGFIVNMWKGVVFEAGLPCGPTWFLVALAWCRILFWMMAKKNTWFIGVVVWAIMLVALRHHSYAWLGSAIMALPFFAVGYFVMRYMEKIGLLVSGLRKPICGMIFMLLSLCLLLSANIWYGSTTVFARGFGNNIMPLHLNVVAMYFLAFVGIGMILLPANWLTARSKSNVVICVEGMGRNSLIIMCLHIIFCAPIRLITSQWTIAGLIVRVIMACIILTVCYSISLWLLHPNFNWLIGKSNNLAVRK